MGKWSKYTYSLSFNFFVSDCDHDFLTVNILLVYAYDSKISYILHNSSASISQYMFFISCYTKCTKIAHNSFTFGQSFLKSVWYLMW